MLELLKFLCDPPWLAIFIPFIIYGLVIVGIGMLIAAYGTHVYDNKLKDR